MSVQYPNKTFVLDTEKDTAFGRRKHFVIVVARDADTAAMYLMEKLGGNVHPNELTWLMDTNHPTLYEQNGEFPLTIQAKILYNTVGFLKEQ